MSIVIDQQMQIIFVGDEILQRNLFISIDS